MDYSHTRIDSSQCYAYKKHKNVNVNDMDQVDTFCEPWLFRWYHVSAYHEPDSGSYDMFQEIVIPYTWYIMWFVIYNFIISMWDINMV